MAHIIALVVKEVLKCLHAGEYADAARILQATEENRGNFADNCNALSVWLKIRTFTLFVQASDERVIAWKAICNVMIPLDVNTR